MQTPRFRSSVLLASILVACAQSPVSPPPSQTGLARDAEDEGAPSTTSSHAPKDESAAVALAPTTTMERKAAEKSDKSSGPPMAVAPSPARPMGLVDAQPSMVSKKTSEAPEADVVSGYEPVPGRIHGLTKTADDRMSTFAIDVDTGSYTLGRRYLQGGSVPQAGSVRVEEWVNAFHYVYADDDATARKPFAIHIEGTPLAKGAHVLKVGIQGKRIRREDRAPMNLVFLADVSGSMSGADRLPLAKKALHLLVDELRSNDRVSLVTYANGSRLVLPATPPSASNRARIHAAIEDLQPGGGTAMGSGMELAYREAQKGLETHDISRVVVLSDGDANIGNTSIDGILYAIRGYVSEGVTLSTVGFGVGNLRDQLMEQLADSGNGNYSYIDSEQAAKRVFVEDLPSTMQVIAKDVKIQVEMDPAVVREYRLIGYENRDIADRDFRNDKVDAGEIGAGHTVTALYEVHLQDDAPLHKAAATVRVRWKQPRGTSADETEAIITAGTLRGSDLDNASSDTRFALAAALAAETFRGSEHMQRLGLSLADAHRLAKEAAVGRYTEERSELVSLLQPLVGGMPVARR
jgi:Ca-activated chloride channel homolog